MGFSSFVFASQIGFVFRDRKANPCHDGDFKAVVSTFVTAPTQQRSAIFPLSAGDGGTTPRLTRTKTGLITDCMLGTNKEVTGAVYHVHSLGSSMDDAAQSGSVSAAETQETAGVPE